MYQYFDVDENGLADIPPNYSLVSHQQTQTVRYECSKCDSLFTSRIFLHHHEASVHNQMFLCPFCPVLFSNKPDFRVHVEAHSEKKYLPCAFCKKVFNQVDEYAAHLKEHREPFMFPCDKCPALFGQYSKLRAHHAVHVQKKFIHNITKVSEDCLSKKLSKKILKKLKSKSKMIQAKKQPQVNSQITDLADQVLLAQAISTPSVMTLPNTAPDIQPDVSKENGDGHSSPVHLSKSFSSVTETTEPVTKNVFNSNREENIRKSSRFLKKKSNLTSDAFVSTSHVSAQDAYPCNSSKNIASSRSPKKPIIKKKIAPKRKRIPPGIDQVTEVEDLADEILVPSVNNKPNERDFSSDKINSRRNLRSRTTLKSVNREVEDSADEIFPSLTNNNTHERDSSDEIISTRNLRPRTTLRSLSREVEDFDDENSLPMTNNELNERDSSSSDKKKSRRNLRSRKILKSLNRGSSVFKPEAPYNLRCRVKTTSFDKTTATLLTNKDKETENLPSSSCRSNIPTGFFMCLSCKRIFSTYRLLNQHKELHINNKGFRCKGCGGLFGGAGNLANHQRSLLCFKI